MTETMKVRGLSRRTALQLATGALAVPAILTSRRAWAAYPDSTITIVVPFAAGGASDLVARVLSGPLGTALKQSVVVKNRPGGGSNIGIGEAARSKPDGYTFLVTSSVFVVNPSLYAKIPYDPYKDFAPVCDCVTSPNAIATTPNSGIASITDLVTKAKAEPNKFNYATPGTGTTPQLSMEMLKLRAGINVTHIPYDGAGPAVVGVLGGQTQLIALNIGSMISHVKSGALKVLVQTGAERWPDLPDVPTMDDSGWKNSRSETFQCLLAPAGTPQPIIDRVSEECIKILNDPANKDNLFKSGLGVVAKGPEVLKARIAREIPMWAEVVKQAGIPVK